MGYPACNLLSVCTCLTRLGLCLLQSLLLALLVLKRSNFLVIFFIVYPYSLSLLALVFVFCPLLSNAKVGPDANANTMVLLQPKAAPRISQTGVTTSLFAPRLASPCLLHAL